jgi:hypothetical protein
MLLGRSDVQEAIPGSPGLPKPFEKFMLCASKRPSHQTGAPSLRRGRWKRVESAARIPGSIEKGTVRARVTSWLVQSCLALGFPLW